MCVRRNPLIPMLFDGVKPAKAEEAEGKEGLSAQQHQRNLSFIYANSNPLTPGLREGVGI